MGDNDFINQRRLLTMRYSLLPWFMVVLSGFWELETA